MAEAVTMAAGRPAEESRRYLALMEIRVLGPLEVVLRGQSLALGGPKQRGLLALLVAAAPDLVAADRLVDGLWGDEASPGSRSTLQTYISNLRHLLGDAVVHDRGGYRLEVDARAIDAVEFTRALEAARVRMAADPGSVAADLSRVLALWRGRPYADLMEVPGLEPEIRRLESLRLEAVELRLDAELASGRHAELVAELEALAEEHPTRERFRAQHMLALYRAGRQADALRAYRRTETYLAEELGVDPSEELKDLELRILQHDQSLLTGLSRAVTQRLAFLVTDIEGSTRLWDRFPQAMATALSAHDRILSEEVEGAGGRVFKHTGDGVLAVFPEAVSAVTAAERVQSRIAEIDWGVIGDLRVRMGIDVGEAEARGDDFFGPPLNRAARLCAIGHGGQVLVSSAAERDVTALAPAGLQVRHLGEVLLRGMATPERVAQMVFVGLPADFPDLRSEAAMALDDRARAMSVPGYEVRDRIGDGAFGVVWRAYQPSVGREVAVKVIRPELASQPSFVRRFEAEARTIARLAHPHIVPLIDFWRDANSAFLVLSLLPGGSLAEAIRGPGLEKGAARRILAQVSAALDHAHSQEVVHGDLKPANVLLDGSGNAYLSDFGIAARLIDPDVVHSNSSAPEFRAPEEATTGPSPAADRFALGVMARTVLGDRPEMAPVLARATARRPEDRYHSAAAFLHDLESVLGAVPETLEVPTVTRNPYKGLRPFDEADAADFYGRDDLLSALLAAVSRHRFVTVVGPSGSGKSSVVRSGLLPALASGGSPAGNDWLPVVFTPGAKPLDALIHALTRISGAPVDGHALLREGLTGFIERLALPGQLLLVIDQFEELYTSIDDLALRRQFVDLLVKAVTGQGGVRVVATLRADFYDRPLADEQVGKLVRDGQVTVLPPTREELIEMIASPAQAVGLRWEPGLPNRIAEDVAHQPGALPLLQYALTELVERRTGALLTGSDYTRIGEVAGALAKRAESLYQTLSPSQQEAVRQVLLRLVTVDEDSDDTRRRVRRTELESLRLSLTDLNAVLDTFTAERLLLADRDPVAHSPTVEVAHEALLREWPRLRGWIDDQREALILGRRFRAALVEWETNERHDDYLLSGTRLAPFSGWAETSSLTADEKAFYRASHGKDQADRLARRRRRRTLTGILSGAALLALVLGSIAAVQAGRATEQAVVARANELSAFASAALGSDPSLAKLLAVASTHASRPSVDTVSVLRQAFAADAVVGRYTWPRDREVGFLWTAVSPDGGRLVAAGCSCDVPSTYLEAYDLEANDVLWSFDEVEDPSIIIDSPIFSPDGKTVVSGMFWLGEDEPTSGPLGAHIWDAETGELIRHIDLGRCGGTVYGASATHLLADSVLADEGACFYQNMAPPGVLLVELDSGTARVLTEGGSHLAMSGDGRYVAYGDRTVEPGLTVVEDVVTGERVLEMDAVHPSERVRALNGDGSLLVLSIQDRLEVRDVKSGETLSSFYGHPAGVWSVTFSKAGDDSIYSTGRAGALLHWEARTGRELRSFPAVGNGNVSMADTGLVVVADQTARVAALLETRPRGELWAVEGSSCGSFILAFSTGVGGEHAAFAEDCPTTDTIDTVVLSLASQEVINVVPGGRWQASKISPDGTRLARVDAGDGPIDTGQEEWFGPVRIRDVLTGEVVVELEGVCTWDIQHAMSTGTFGTDQAGCAAYPEKPFPIFPDDVFWSPDGERVAVWSVDLVVAWDALSGELISGYDGCQNVRGVYFDGDRIVVYCDEGDRARMVFVDADTGEETQSVEIERLGTDALGITGFTPDGSSLVGVRGINGVGGGSLVWFDTQTFEVTTLPRIHDGSPKSFTTSPSGKLVATGSSDGFIKVWDVVDRRQVHEIQLGDTEVQGLAFIDEDRVAAVTQKGLFSVYTLDVEELVQLVGDSLTRGFTATECARYGFGDECPTLDELRGGT